MLRLPAGGERLCELGLELFEEIAPNLVRSVNIMRCENL
jgi:hypothetical protein